MKPAKKSLGQNFLIDPNYQRKITGALLNDISDHSPVLEVGPGRGALTEYLLERKAPLFLVEKDRDLAAHWQDRSQEIKNLKVICDDILEVDLSFLNSGDFFVLSNLPYNISTQILIRFLENKEFITKMVLMFQKEVAMRCLAQPGSKDYGILSVWAQCFSRVKKVCDVPPSVFRPRPKVTSTVLEFYPDPEPFSSDDRAFIEFVRKIFSQRRKKISSILKKEGFSSSDSRFQQRAEEFNVSELKDLFEVYSTESQ